MIRQLMLAISLIITFGAFAQDQSTPNFTIVSQVEHTPVISQGITGTCWGFSTTSFVESEIMRLGNPEVNLSEMFFVYYNYQNKAFQYLLYQGRNNFGQGSLSHDVIKIIREKGLMTYDALPGYLNDGKYNHNKLEGELKSIIEKTNSQKEGTIDVSDFTEINSVLNEEIGTIPAKMNFEGNSITPIQLRDELKFNPDDYIELTSFTHHPFYEKCVVEVPDNWAHESYYNLPMDELIEVMNNALSKGYSIVWDGDVSEKGFSHKNGVADVPAEQQGKITQQLHQETFYNRTTTDDHLMHMVGLSKDDAGKNYFYTKNSWGANSNHCGGFVHISEDYVRLKTIGILIHKDALPKKTKKALNIK